MSTALRDKLRRLRAGRFAAILCLPTILNSPGNPEAAAQESPIRAGLSIRSLKLEPETVVLCGANRQQRVLVTAETKDGRLIDASRDCELVTSNTAVAVLVGSQVVGVANGEAELLARCGDLEARVPIRVIEFDAYPPVHFGNDIVPLFSKLGCNSGGCHGKASGQNGFRLSVFGFDPEADFNAIVKEARGRRVFPASPDRSLILSKPSGGVPHGGGRRMEVGSRDYELLRQWIVQGMPWGRDDAAQSVALRISPAERVMGVQSGQQIVATAVFSDGTLRDVTDAAAYVSNSSLVAEVDSRGLVQTGKVTGEAAITVNYMGHVAAVRIQVPRVATGVAALESAKGVLSDRIGAEFQIKNRIDELVSAKLKKMGIAPSELADDATFLRRLYIDAIGTLPRPEEVRAFLADQPLTPGAPGLRSPSRSPPKRGVGSEGMDKRARAIDAVLARDEYADYWSLKWSDILLVDRNKLGDRGAFELHRWLREQFAHNRPYDEWVRELITATGNSDQVGPVNFYRAVRTPEQLAESVSQAFLGVRVQCAQCHHHPFEKWSQADFYGMSGFFNGIERKPARGTTEPTPFDRRSPVELVYHAGYRETRIPLFDKLAPTQPLGGWVPGVESSSPQSSIHAAGGRGLEDSTPGTPNLASGDPRVRLADWMTDPKNPWFARLVANRLWKHFLGRGLVEPEDDIRSTNPATNEPLLDYLAEQVVANRYDLKAVMRLILNSRVYQLSSVPNETNRDDDQNFSHYYVKRMPAEVLLDAISEVTGVPESFPGTPRGTRAIELWDNRLPSYFLDTFGRSERTSPCECGRSSEPTMTQALHLMNGPEVERKITSPTGRVARLSQIQTADSALIEDFCLAALGRLPTAKEEAVTEKLFGEAPRQRAAEDFLWTLLNSYDFLFVR